MSSINITSLSSAHDLLAKLQREIARLRDAQENNGSDEEVLDHGLNAALTGWHIFEAVARERGITEKKKVTQFGEQVAIQSPDLGLLHDVATHVKHFKVSNALRANPTQGITVGTSVRSTITPAEEQGIMEGLRENPMGAHYFRPENNFQTVLKIDGQDALDVLQRACDYWATQIGSR
jgi:hypothetical protein